MSTIYPRQRVLPADISTSTSINYLPHLSYILSLDPSLDHRCAGYVDTNGRRCTTETKPQDRSEAIALLNMATADVRAGMWRDIENETLEELARRLLCSASTHQAQARSLVQRWRADFQAFVHGTEIILGLNDADMMTEWNNMKMDLDNESWYKQVSRGIQWGFDHLALAQLVRGRDPGFLYASRALRENLAHQHLQGSSSDWNGNVDREFSIDPEPGRTTSTNTSTGHGIYNNPSTNAQHPPVGIPAPTRNHSSAFGLSRLAPKKTEMSRNHQDNTVERLRQPIDGDCSICLISLLDEPSDFDFYTDYAYTDSITDRLSSPFSDSSCQWHETDTGTPGLTDLMRRDYAYHRVLSYICEGGPEINVSRQGKVGERKYPARLELSWCQAGCGVNYHKRCLDKWIAMAPSGLATCPSCRRRWVGDFHHRGSPYGCFIPGLQLLFTFCINPEPLWTEKANQNPHSENPDIRVTDTHIYFLRGILSNWYLSPYHFTGQRALELCLAQLDELGIPHLAEDAISTRLIKPFRFRRGEQWMMAMKAWLFERDSTPLGESVLDDASFDQLQAELLSDKPVPGSNDPRRKELRESALCRIMRTNNPKSQKTLGRKVPNFDDAVWTTASGVIVVAGCIARAEADDELRKLYFSSEKRVFVEGSASDRVWAVGLNWESDEILDEGNWRGTNRLGKAHSEAARILSDSSAAR